jgi:hypothetical protein
MWNIYGVWRVQRLIHENLRSSRIRNRAYPRGHSSFAMVDTMPFLPGLSPVQGKAVVARFAADEGGQDGVTRRFGVDRRCDRHPRPQLSGERIIRVDGNFDRDALDDLSEVPGGVVSGGNSANCWPLAGARFSTWPNCRRRMAQFEEPWLDLTAHAADRGEAA